jgi:hypothetical protein
MALIKACKDVKLVIDAKDMDALISIGISYAPAEIKNEATPKAPPSIGINLKRLD